MRSGTLSRKLRLVRLALLWERALPSLTAAVSLTELFFALALLDVAPLLPFWAAAGLAPLFALAVLLLLIRAVRVPRPGRDEVARRLEQDNGARHNPLAVLEDERATGDEALWRLHQARAEAEALRLRPGLPHPVMAERDPLGLRFAALLLLVIAATAGLGEAGPRLARAVDPWSTRPVLEDETLEVWIVPPVYTGLGQTLLKPGGGAVAVPAGSRARAVTSWRGGLLGAALSAGGDATEFDSEGRAELTLGGGPSLDVRLGLRLAASWPLSVIPDAPPALTVTRGPAGDERGRLGLEAEAVDDYGLTRAWVEIRPEGDPAAQPLRLDLALSGAGPRKAALVLRADLAEHDWAGRPVRVVVKAEDGAGQVSSTAAMAVVLPERDFRKPLARALADWRRRLSDAPRLGPEAAEILRAILEQPQDFGDDVRVFLSLSVTRHMLLRPVFERDRMRSLLWYAATRIEDGGLPAAERGLEEARGQLERALAQGAAPEDLARLVDELEAAMDKLLDALTEQGSLRDGPSGGDAADLNDVFDQLRAMAETGDREGLKRLLEQLGQWSADLGRSRPGEGPDPAAAEALKRLRETAERQRELLDQSFRNAPADREDEAPPPAATPRDRAEARKAAEAQRALRRSLDETAKSPVLPPDSLSAAQRAMEQAESELAAGRWAEAAEAQAQALAGLQEASRQLRDRMEAARGQGVPGLRGRDPFGRMLNNGRAGDDRSTKVPARAETQRAREILEELRRRAGEVQRPEPERDYLKRLLKPY